jgi:hypothetical protein
MSTHRWGKKEQEEVPSFRRLSTIFAFPWHECTLACWRKWPHPSRPDILSVDLINKRLDPETGALHATRLMIMRGWLPRWIQAFTRSNICIFVEESITDPRNQRLIQQTRNISYSNLVELVETCIYTPVEEEEGPSSSSSPHHQLLNSIKEEATNDSDFRDLKQRGVRTARTRLRQRADATAKVMGLAKKIEDFCLDRYVTTALANRPIMDQTLRNVHQEMNNVLTTKEKDKDRDTGIDQEKEKGKGKGKELEKENLTEKGKKKKTNETASGGEKEMQVS